MATRRKPAAVDEEQDPIPDVAIEEAAPPPPAVGFFIVEARRNDADDWRAVVLSTVALSPDGRDILRAPWLLGDIAAANDVAAMYRAAGFEAQVVPHAKD